MRKATKQALTEYSKVKITFQRKKIKEQLEPINKSHKAADLFRAFFEPGTIELTEYFYAAYLDNMGKPLAVVKINGGCLDSVTVDGRAVVRIALECNAASVFVCHNHPSGNLKPSQTDRMITKLLIQALQLFMIRLLDHIILTDKGHFSMADEGLL